MRKSITLHRYGGPEVFELRDEPTQPVHLDSVKIRVTASGVNFADLMMRMGAYPEAPKRLFVPGYEIAGVVTEVGASVHDLHPGNRVLAATRFGGYTNEIVLPAYQVRKTPKNLSDIEAAAIPVNFLTAWIALNDMARVRKGDRVLVMSAAGGVGVAAIQIAAHAGAHVVGIVGTENKAKVVRSLGASETITQEVWENAEDDEMGGYQVILDSVGGESLKRSIRRLAPGGRVITFGVSSMISGPRRSLIGALGLLWNTALLTPFKLMMENKGVFGLNLLQLYEPPIPGRSNLMIGALDEILKRFEEGQFKVIVGKTFPLAQAGNAQTYLQSRQNIGKVVLIPPQD